MTTVRETIPDGLQPEVDAALAWFNRQEEVEFEVTGILDPDDALAASGTRELHLVLCGGYRCELRSFRVAASGDGYDIDFANTKPKTQANTPAELDPPPGARRRWLERVLGQHAFVVLIFYRGFW